MRSGWKIRRLSFLLLPLTFLLLSGCYNYDQELTLNRNGSGTLRVLIEYEQFALPGETDQNIEQRETRTCSESIMGFDSIEGVELGSCSDWIENFTVFEEARYSFEDIGVLSAKGWSYSWERDGGSKVFRMSYDTGEDEPTEKEKEGARKEMEGYRGARFTVTLPKEIAEAPGAVIEGNTATWDYPWEKVINEGLTRIDMEASVKLNFLQRIFGW